MKTIDVLEIVDTGTEFLVKAMFPTNGNNKEYKEMSLPRTASDNAIKNAILNEGKRVAGYHAPNRAFKKVPFDKVEIP